jgi:hypothetical protein
VKLSCLIPALMVIAMACMGQSIQISGTVKDSATGVAVKSAIVRLAQNGLTDTTDNAGNFSLVGTGTNIMAPGLGTSAPEFPVFFSSGEIRFTLYQEERVAIRAYSVQGKQLYSMRRTFQTGAHSVLPKQLPAGIYFYKVDIGNTEYSLAQIHVDGATNFSGMAKSVHGAEGAQSSAALSKSLAALQDTILVTAAGYVTKRTAVSQSVVTGLVIKVVAGGSAIKWHPGFYGLTGATTKSASSLGYTSSMVTNLVSEPNIKGILHFVYWGALEPTRGNYDFSTIDTLLSLCQANNKRLMILILDRTFSGNTNNGVLPSYLATESGGEGGWAARPGGTAGIVARLWLPAIMDRQIALYKAMAAHTVSGTSYTLDTHPYYEGTYTEESTPGTGVVTGAAGFETYTRALWAAQLKRWMAEVPPAWPHTNVVQQINFLSGEVDGLVATAAANRIMIASPDIVPGSPSTGQRVFGGQTEAGGTGPNYHGVMGAGWQIQGPELLGRYGTFTVQQYYDMAVSIGSTHLPILMRVDAGADPTWTSPGGGFLAFIHAGGHPLEIGCPSNYPGCNTN